MYSISATMSDNKNSLFGQSLRHFILTRFSCQLIFCYLDESSKPI